MVFTHFQHISPPGQALCRILSCRLLYIYSSNRHSSPFGSDLEQCLSVAAERDLRWLPCSCAGAPCQNRGYVWIGQCGDAVFGRIRRFGARSWCLVRGRGICCREEVAVAQGEKCASDRQEMKCYVRLRTFMHRKSNSLQ